jgi:hypothetical protein
MRVFETVTIMKKLILIIFLSYSSSGITSPIPKSMSIEQFVKLSKPVVKERHQTNKDTPGVVYPFDVFSENNTVIFGIRDESYDRIPLPVSKEMYGYMFLRQHLSMCFSDEFEERLKPIFDRGWKVEYVSFGNKTNKSIIRHLISEDLCSSLNSRSVEEVLNQVSKFYEKNLPLTFVDNTTFLSFSVEESQLVETWEVNLQSTDQIREISPTLSDKGIKGMMVLLKTFVRGSMINDVCRGPTYRKFLDNGYVVSKLMFLKDGTEFDSIHFNTERCNSILSQIDEDKP